MAYGNDAPFPGHGLLSSKYATKPKVPTAAARQVPSQSKIYQNASAPMRQKVEPMPIKTAVKEAAAVSSAYRTGSEAYNGSSNTHVDAAKVERKADPIEIKHTGPNEHKDESVRMVVEAIPLKTTVKEAAAVSSGHKASNETSNGSSKAHVDVAKVERKAGPTEIKHTGLNGQNDESVKMLVEALVASQQQTQTVNQSFARSQQRMESLEDRLSSANQQNSELEKHLTKAQAEISHLKTALGAAEKKNKDLSQEFSAKSQMQNSHQNNTEANDKAEVSKLSRQIKDLQFQLSKAANSASTTTAGLRKQFMTYMAKFKVFYEHDKLGSRQYAELTQNLQDAKDLVALHGVLEKFLTTTCNMFIERLLKNKEALNNIKNQLIVNQRTRHPQLKGLTPVGLSIVQCIHVLHALTEGMAKQPRAFEDLLRAGSSEILVQAKSNKKLFVKDCQELTDDPLGRTAALLFYEVKRNGKFCSWMQQNSKAVARLGSLQG